MTVADASYTFAIVAAIFSSILLYHSLTIDKKKEGEKFFILSILFMLASFSGIETGLWYDGSDMFKLIISPWVPLDFFFAVCYFTIIYLSERYFQNRKIWVIVVVFSMIIFFIAYVIGCMDCIQFS
ncbi:MAG: hypothetical protein ACFFCW_11235 [Candidatus Hodarchaeota archaeon]